MAHICKQCDKKYSSYKSLWYHNYKYHKEEKEKNVALPGKNVALLGEKVFLEKNNICSYCNKILCDRKYRWKHEKICKVRIFKENKVNEENIELKETVKQLTKDVEEMKKHIKKANSKITNNNINNGNIINNNIQINAIGYEDFSKILTDNQQLNVLTAGLYDDSPILELVRKTYNDDSLKENRNTYIPNLQSTNCLTYNNEKKRFDAVNKNKHIENIIKNRKDDIIKMYAKHGNKMKPAHKKIFNEYIENINNNESIKNKELYKKHKEEINLIIYNDKEFMKKVKDIVDKTEIKDEDSEEEEDLEDEEDVVEEPPVQNIVL
jgi:desulfoferrodoxin (superoxide reductase-like protein)